MMEFRRRIFRVVPWGLGCVLLGCQAPDAKPPGIHNLADRPARSSVPAKPAAAKPRAISASVLKELKPADWLSSRRPDEQRAVSVARFVEELEVPERPVQVGTQKEEEAKQ